MKRILIMGTAAIAMIAVTAVIVLEWRKPAYQRELESGFESLLEDMATASEYLTSLLAFAPPRNERDLSEGYRYLMGHLLRISAAELARDPLNPAFERAVTPLSKWTGDNPDNLYLIAAIDGSEQYTITGRVPWSDATDVERLSDIPQAPGLVLFQTVTDLIGDTGELSELTSCRNQTFAALSSFDMQVASDGSFEILLAPDRPNGYGGNWLDTAAQLECRQQNGEVTRADKVARFVAIREIFIDWEQEWPLELDIVRISRERYQPEVATAAERAEQMRAIGEKLKAQVKFWNGVMRLGLEAHGDFNFDGELRLPVNDVNTPAPPFLAGGTAGSRQLYASGMYDLGPDDALILSVAVPHMPEYFGFQLGNVWMESLDFANHASSRNQSQLEFDRRGNTYIVVAHRDPGVANWVDTTGIERGQMTFRFWYDDPPASSAHPRITAQTVPLATVARSTDHTGRPSPAERAAEIEVRRQHVRRRFRRF